MLQYELKQLSHDGLAFGRPDRLVAVPGDKQSFAAVVTLRGVAIVDGVGALQISRGFALQHACRVSDDNS